MGDDDGAGEWPDERLDLIDVAVERAGSGIGHDGHAATQRHRHHAPGVGDGGHHHFGEGLDAERTEGDVDGACARIDRIGVAAAQTRREFGAVRALLLSSILDRAPRRHRAVDHLPDGAALLRADQAAIRQFRDNRSAAIDGEVVGAHGGPLGGPEPNSFAAPSPSRSPARRRTPPAPVTSSATMPSPFTALVRTAPGTGSGARSA